MKSWLPIVWFCVWFLSLGLHLAKDGEPRDGKYSFFFALWIFLISCFVAWCGGFFTVL